MTTQKSDNPHSRWTEPIGINIIRDQDGNIKYPTDPIDVAWSVLFEAAYYFESVTGDMDLVFELMDRRRKWEPPQK